MLIQSIKLENFRQFRGKHELTFSTDSQKNVTVIMGENGAGKTTLEQAFLWCFYGDTSFKNKELINREARDEMLPQDTCKVKVELDISQYRQNYRLRRIQIFTRGQKRDNVVESFDFYRQNENGEWVRSPNRTASDARVDEMLPQKLSKFFFFDGERIEGMSRELLERKNSGNFEQAVRGLVGLSAISSAIEHFGSAAKKTSVIGKFNKEISDDTDTKIKDMEVEIEDLTQKIEKNEAEYENADSERKRSEQDYGKSQQELNELSNDIKRRQKYESLQSRIRSWQNRRDESIKVTFTRFSKLSGQALSQPLLQAAMEELKDADKLDKGIPYIHADTIKFLLNRKKCVCGASLENDEEKCRCLNELIPDLPPQSLGQMVGQFSRDVKIRVNTVSGFRDEIQRNIQEIQRYEQDIERAADEMRDLEKHMADQDKVTVLRRRMQQAKDRGGEYAVRCRNLLSNLTRDKDHKKHLETERLTSLAGNKRNQINLRYLKYAQAVCDALTESYEGKEQEVRQQLEDKINEIFMNIYDGGIQIHISEHYNISTTVTETTVQANGDDLEQNTAQSYAIIFAFISGIIELVKDNGDFFEQEDQQVQDREGYPLVMDAPLSSFDKKRIHNICHALPEIAEQIIIFIKDTDGETAEEHLKEKIGAKWDLVADSKTNSRLQRRA